MEGELVGRDLLLLRGLREQPLGQLGALAIGDHPANDVTAENVQDDVEIEVRSI